MNTPLAVATEELDPFNPSNWAIFQQHEYRIYADDNAFRWAVVDEEDYQWAIKWRWHINKPHPTRNGKKEYFCRNPGSGGRYKPKLFLHVEIMKRTGILPPSKLHKVVDHLDGNECNCRRSNLIWATILQNNRNRFGVAARNTDSGPEICSIK